MHSKTTSAKNRVVLNLLALLLVCYNFGCVSGNVAKSENTSDKNRKVHQTIYTEVMLKTYDVTFSDVEHNLRGHQTILK